MRNKTTLFLLPCLDIKLDKNLFQSAYIYHVKQIVLKFSGVPKDTTSSIKHWENNGFHYLVFDIPKKFHRDYYMILAGQYSSISDELKSRIRTLYGNKSKVFKVITKHPEIRRELEEKIGQSLTNDQELMSIIDMEEEQYESAKGKE